MIRYSAQSPALVVALVVDQTVPAELLEDLEVVLPPVAHLVQEILLPQHPVKVTMVRAPLPVVKVAQVAAEVPLKQVRPVVLLQVEKAVTELPVP